MGTNSAMIRTARNATFRALPLCLTICAARSSVSPTVCAAGPAAHTVGLTEERAAQIVKQSGSARNVAFLAVLIIALFVPIYWFYDIGVPALGVESRLQKEADAQYVSDVQQGY